MSPSLLSWERGLKSSESKPPLDTLKSLLSWERGLKCVYEKAGKLGIDVAPLVGAWIEIIPTGT